MSRPRAIGGGHEQLAELVALWIDVRLGADSGEQDDSAKERRDAPKRGATRGLTDDELAVYDALTDHGGVKELMTDKVLTAIAHERVEAIRKSVAVRADLCRKVIEQAERVARDWAHAS